MNIQAPATATRETLADLERTTEKAELIEGRIVLLMPTGYQLFLRGQVADAQPAVRGWQIAVDRIFP